MTYITQENKDFPQIEWECIDKIAEGQSADGRMFKGIKDEDGIKWIGEVKSKPQYAEPLISLIP